MAHQLRAVVTLPQDLSSVQVNTEAQNYSKLEFLGDSMPSSSLQGHCTHVLHIHTCRQNTHKRYLRHGAVNQDVFMALGKIVIFPWLQHFLFSTIFTELGLLRFVDYTNISYLQSMTNKKSLSPQFYRTQIMANVAIIAFCIWCYSQ